MNRIILAIINHPMLEKRISTKIILINLEKLIIGQTVLLGYEASEFGWHCSLSRKN